MKKLISILVAFAMMATLCVCMAFAETEVQNAIAVTKQLNAANDILPSELAGTVRINFAFQSATGDAATNTPQVESKYKDITITATENKVPGEASTAYYYSTGALDADFFGLDNTKKPGVYTYWVTETDNGITAGKENENKTGSETSKKFVLTILKDKNGNLTFTASEEGKEGKTDIKPGTDNTSIQGNGLSFKNNLFDELGNENTTYENSPFKMKKIVDDKASIYNDEKFNFDFTVVLPDGATFADDVEAYKVIDGVETAIDVASTNSVSLGHDDYVYFKKIPAGSKVSALENDERVGDAAKSGKMYYSTDKGEAAQTLNASGVVAEVTNVSDKEGTMEGILNNSIPYIVLALVAIGGMAAYVVVRRRNADEA